MLQTEDEKKRNDMGSNKEDSTDSSKDDSSDFEFSQKYSWMKDN